VNRSTRWMLLLPLVGATATLTWLSSIPELATPDLGFTWQDKFYHLVAYSVYGVAASIAVYGWLPTRALTTQRWVVLAIGCAFGGIDEVHQSFVPGRDGSGYDWIADVLGTGLAVLILPRLHAVLAALLRRLIPDLIPDPIPDQVPDSRRR
jgi:VanZ family protein